MIKTSNNRIKLSLLLVMIVLATCRLLPGGQEDSLNILLLDSYSSGSKWSDIIISEIGEGLAGYVGNEEYTLYVEHVNSQTSQNSLAEKTLAKSLMVKYDNFKFDLAISLGNSELAFAKAFLVDNILRDIPVISYNSDSQLPTIIRLWEKKGGERLYKIDEMLTLIRKVMPELKDLIVIAGNNEMDFLAAMANYSDGGTGAFNVRCISGHEYETQQLYLQADSFRADQAIIYAGWSGGCDGNFVDTYQVCRTLARRSKAPIFAISSDYLGEGVVGGHTISGRAVGGAIAELVLKEFGYDFKPNPAYEKICQNIFDLDMLLKLNMSTTAIPADAEVVESGSGSGSYGEGYDANGLTVQESNWIMENPVATVAMLIRPPLVMSGDNGNGFAIDYIELLAEKAGITIHYDYSYNNIAECLEEVRGGGGPDIIAAMEKNADRSQYLIFSKCWTSMYYTLFVNKNAGMVLFEGLDDLAGKTIAIERGSNIHNVLLREHSTLTLLECDNVIKALQAVSDGQAFGWLGDQVAGLYCIKEYGIDNVTVGSTLYEFGRHNFSFAVRKDKPLLFSVLNKQAAKLTANELNQLYLRYLEDSKFNPGINTKLVREMALGAAFVAAMILAIQLFRIRRASNQVWNSGERLRVAFESIGDAGIVTDQNGMVVRVNKVAEELTGWTRTEMIGKPFSEIFDLVDSDTMLTIELPVEVVMKNGRQTDDSVAALIDRDGRRYYISYNASPVVTADVGCVGVVVIFRDITGEFEMNRRINQAQKEKGIIFDNITVGVCFYDKNFYPVSYNQQMEFFCGESIAQRISRGHEPDQNECLPTVMHKFNISKGSDNSGRDGYELEVTALPIMENDKPIGILEMVVDVTEYRQLQRELENAYDELAKYSGNLEQQVKLQTFELQDRNDQLDIALEELRVAQSQLVLSEKMAALGQLISGISQEITVPLDMIASSVNNIRRSMKHLTENITTVDGYFRGENANLIQELIRIGVEYRRSGMILSTRESRKLRRRIIAEMENAGIKQHADYFTSMLIGMGVANAWYKFMPLLRQDNVLDVLYEISGVLNIGGSCATVLKAVNNASQIVLALKSYVHSSSHSHNGGLTESIVDIVAGIRVVLVLFNSRMKDLIQLKLDLQEVPPVMAVSDELNQVWTNILRNAIDTMKSGGILTVSTKEVNGGASISFADTGGGMSPEAQARIFEPSFTKKTSGESVGMGMDIVRRVIEDNLCGKVTIENQENVGTTVTIWLPGTDLK